MKGKVMAQYEIQLVHNHNANNVINLKVDGNHPVWKCLHEFYETRREFSRLMLWEPVLFKSMERDLTYKLLNLESEAVVLLGELFDEDFDNFYIN